MRPPPLLAYSLGIMKRLAVLAVVAAAALHVDAAITGTVVDATGSPVANVRVDAYRPIHQYHAMAMFAKLAAVTPLATARTDAKGAFTIDLPGRGVADVHATADGYAPADVFAAYDDSTTLTLRKAMDIAGSVTANGKPVAGAVVVAIASEGFPVVVKSDAQGAFHLPDPKSWAQYVAVAHPDFAAAAHPPANLTFVLDAGRDVKGKVIDEKGAVVAGAEISIDGMPYGKSAGDGTFEAKHVPQRSAAIGAKSAAGAASMRIPSGTPILRLKRSSRVTGIVRDAAKQPLAGIAVLGGGDEGGYDFGYTDAKGAYTLTIARGQYTVSPEGFGVYSIEDAEVDGRGGDVRHDFEAQRERYVSGIVRMRDGSPVPGAAIGLRSESNAPGMQMEAPVVIGSLRTGADGRFRISRSGETKFTIVALKRGLPAAESATLTEASADRGVTITIPEGIAISGKVVDAEHHPLAGVAIDPILGYGGERMLGVRADATEAWATTKDDGTFSAELSRGSIALNFSKKGFVATQQMVDVEPGMPSVDVTLATGASIHGVVVNKDGSPAPEIPVVAGEHYAMSSADGTFSIDDVEPGDYVLQFGRTAMQQKSIHIPSDDIRLVLGGTRQISGRVTDSASGAPVEQFTVWVRSESDRTMPEPVSSATGEFQVEAPEGRVTVNVSAPGYATAKNVAVTEGSALAIALSRGRTIRGRVSDSSGQPLGDVDVSVSSSDVDDYVASDKSPRTAADGAYELAGLAFDNDLTMTFRKEGYVQEQRKVRAANEDAKIDVTLRNGIAVTGRVIDASGGGVAEASVSASSATHGAAYDSAETDKSGVFRFAGLAPGRYEFSAEASESSLKGDLKDVDIEKVREITIRVDKHPTAVITGHVTGLDNASIIRMVTATNELQDSATAMIDAGGNFRIEAPAGLLEVRAQMSSRRGSRQSRPVAVDAPAGSERRVDLAFADQVKLHGTVTRGGAPAAGVRIMFGSSGSDGAMATVSAEGTYDTLLEPGEYDVTMYDSDRAIPFSQHLTVASDSEADFRIETSSIRITVVDGDTSQPLDGATLNLMHGSGTHSVGSATTGADGSATVEVPRSDALTVTASRRGYANAVADISAGSTTPVVMRLARSAGAVVRLVDRRDGRTLTGYVIARDDAGRLLASTYEEEADGTVTLPLPAGRYRFSGSAEGYGSQTVIGEAGTSEVKIALPRGGGIALRSTNDLHGTARLIQPDGQEYVRCWCNGIATIEINGRVTLVDRISPGPYTLEVSLTGAKPRAIPITVVEGQTLPVPIE